jgi:hypothetical protein
MSHKQLQTDKNFEHVTEKRSQSVQTAHMKYEKVGNCITRNASPAYLNTIAFIVLSLASLPLTHNHLSKVNHTSD